MGRAGSNCRNGKRPGQIIRMELEELPKGLRVGHIADKQRHRRHQ
jgi:hypothetical protein